MTSRKAVGERALRQLSRKEILFVEQRHAENANGSGSDSPPEDDNEQEVIDLRALFFYNFMLSYSCTLVKCS